MNDENLSMNDENQESEEIIDSTMNEEDNEFETNEFIDVNDNTTEDTVLPAKSPFLAIGIVAVIVVALVIGGIFMFNNMGNKYNKMGYVDVTGRTLQQVVDEQGVDLEEFKKQFGLPADMTGDTIEAAAYSNIPFSVIIDMYGFGTVEEAKSELELSDDITESMPWGEVEGQITLKNYVGEENLEAFKEEYNLGDDVTLETQWKTIRKKVDTIKMEQRKEADALQSDEISE